MKTVFALLVGMVGLLVGGGPMHSALASDDVVMVELYTSQGCSSCPPADQALGRISKMEGVLALSFHVDYWDYLGWQDTFGSRENTNRQFSYRDYLGARVVYTPQIVVHGTREAPAYREEAIRSAILDIASSEPTARITIARENDNVSAAIDMAQSNATAVIWMAAYRKSATVEIQRGENAGRTMTYHNVVEKLMRVGEIRARRSHTIALPQPTDDNGIAIWLQDKATGRILTASFLDR